jgi:hypothetical protein
MGDASPVSVGGYGGVPGGARSPYAFGTKSNRKAVAIHQRRFAAPLTPLYKEKRWLFAIPF